jgi:thiamine-phosphate diphosphorylase
MAALAPWPPSHPVLCLVTDRIALAAAAAAPIDPLEALRRQVAAAVDAGIDLVHLRERDLEAGRLRDLTGDLEHLARGTATRIVVNDRVDVAIAAGADGVHLRGDSLDASEVRGLAPPVFLVGRSIRSAEAAREAAGADYLVLGTVFDTASKPGLTALAGPEGLRAAARAASVPVLAIGGVTAARIAAVARSGAAGVAAIRLFFAHGPGAARTLARDAEAWRAEFDRNRPIS